MIALEAHLRARRAAGHKLLVPYVTGGLAGWLDVVRAIADAGADAVEIGIPFSDPVMDGVTIQEASQRALTGGATPAGIIDEAAGLDVGIPLSVMGIIRSAFVIDEAGKIAAAFYKISPKDTIAHVTKALKGE